MAKPVRYTQDMIDQYTARGYWTAETTSALWDRNAELFGRMEALVDSRKRLTWSEMKERSDRLAMNLLDIGFQRDELILLLVPNCVESYIIRVACEKAGILCSTAMMTLRENEIEYILRNFDAVAVAIPRTFRNFDYYTAIHQMRPRLPSLKYIFTIGDEVLPGTMSIEKMMKGSLEERYPAEGFVNTEIKATEVSVIACTSGTTGLPKGVEHAQCTRMAAARNYGSAVRLRHEDVVLNIVSGIAGLGAAFCYNGSAALVGAKTVLSEVWNPENTFQLIEKEKATVLVAVPAQLAQIVKDPNLNQYDLSSLRCITTGTAPLPSRLAAEVEETMKIPISNCYGQLDGGVVTHTSIDDAPEVRRRTVGRPPKGMVVKLVDEQGHEAPEGEIVYSGPATNGGYYKDLDLTLKAWGSLGLEGFFRSGDLGRFDESGNLILIGRKKEVIIRGGQNIYPTEIEGLLLTHPKIRSVALVPMPDPIMGEKACAFVVTKNQAEFTFDEMIAFLMEKKIANYKLPERLEIRSSLPLRGEQKVAKKALIEEITNILNAEGNIGTNSI